MWDLCTAAGAMNAQDDRQNSPASPWKRRLEVIALGEGFYEKAQELGGVRGDHKGSAIFPTNALIPYL